jgi:hypothetical protein
MAHSIFKNWRPHFYGLLTWAIPFIVAIFFYDQTGTLQIPETLFKSIMIVIGGITGVALLVLIFGKIAPTFKNGLTIGVYWLLLNWILDWFILIPLSNQTFGEYFSDIGLRYLVVPVIAAAIGYVAERNK